MGTNSKLNILIVTPFALWMYIICISNIIMQELSGATIGCFDRISEKWRTARSI